MGIAEATGFAFGFSNISPTDARKLANLLIVLFASFGFHLGFDPRSFFADAVHDLLGLRAQIRFRPREAEVKPR